MLNITTCTKILNSDIWKTWSADWITRMSFENKFQLVPEEILEKSLIITFNMTGRPQDAMPGSLKLLYENKGFKPLTLKEMLASLPKSFYMQRVK